MAEHIICNDDGLSLEAGPLATQRDLLIGWQDAKSIHEWFSKYKSQMFPEGRIVGIYEEGIVIPSQRFGGLTPLGFAFEMAYHSHLGRRKDDWRYLATKLLKNADPDNNIGMVFGIADRRTHFNYEDFNQIPGQHNQYAYRWDGNRVSFREVRPVYPLDFLLEQPWQNSEADWKWVEKNASRSNIQKSLEMPGVEEKPYGFEMALYAWSNEPNANKAEYRKSILKALDYIKPETNEEILGRVARQAQAIFVYWAKTAKNDATEFLDKVSKLTGQKIWEIKVPSNPDFEKKRQELVSRKERKLLLKSVSNVVKKGSQNKIDAL